MKYTIDENYQNFKFSVKMRDSARLYDLRKKLEETYGWNMSNFLFTWVHDKQIIHIFNSSMTIKEFVAHNQGVSLVYEIPAALNPQLPAQD